MEQNLASEIDVEMQCLRDDVPWREIFPELPTVEAARQLEDPVLWLKADDISRGVVEEDGISKPSEQLYCSFFLAGYSADDLSQPFRMPGAGSLSILSVGQFSRGYDRRFYGVSVYPQDGEMDWEEINDDLLECEGPGSLEVCIDSSWKPKRYSEVLKEYPNCKLPPSVDVFEETNIKGLEPGQFQRILVEGYRSKVVITDFGTLRERYRLGEIREIVCVAPGERFLNTVADAAWSPLIVDYRLVTAEPSVSIATRRNQKPSVTAGPHVLPMARRGELLLIHDCERRKELPDDWKRHCLLIDAVNDSELFEAIFEPPVAYVHWVKPA